MAYDQDPIFIIGAPRSGTTWLKALLAEHPLVATGPETHLFCSYLGQTVRQWNQDRWRGPHEPNDGLHSYLSENQFYSILRHFAETVFLSGKAKNSKAAVFVEKTPDHGLAVKSIRRCFPNCKFIYVIRDGRDVAASLLAASTGWGRKWAAGSIHEAAWQWRKGLLAARTARQYGKDYLEVHFEVMRREGYRELERVLDLMDMPHTMKEVVAIYDHHRLRSTAASAESTVSRQNLSKVGQNPPGFVWSGAVGGWKSSLNTKNVKILEAMCGDLLLELGYEVPSHYSSTRRRFEIFLCLVKKILRIVKTTLVGEIRTFRRRTRLMSTLSPSEFYDDNYWDSLARR